MGGEHLLERFKNKVTPLFTVRPEFLDSAAQGPAPIYTGFFLGPRPILSTSFVKIRSVVFAETFPKNHPATNKQTNEQTVAKT